MTVAWPKKKFAILVGMLLLYVSLGISFKMLVVAGIIEPAPATIIEEHITDTAPDTRPNTPVKNLESAKNFVNNHLVRENGHIDLYANVTNGTLIIADSNTNSEAVSYYLYWNAVAKNKSAFDKELAFIQQYMIHPTGRYMMWRLNSTHMPEDDGSNVATDADLRAIKALLIAEEQWGDQKYTDMISQLAQGLEFVAITDDNMLAPYAGMSGETPWKTQEVWLSYEDFTVFEELAQRRGSPWGDVYKNMKNATLGAQIHNGLYNTELTAQRQYGNGLDGGHYSINSLWIMVRNAESNDPELQASAQKALEFYKQKLSVDAELYATYTSNGDASSPTDTPWVYALVGRAAVALDDIEFADALMQKLYEHQVTDEESFMYGAFPEGGIHDQRVGQFTMQESIITLQDYLIEKRLIG